MADGRKIYSAMEALEAIENDEFDDFDFSESDDSDNDERMDADCIVDGGMLVDLVDMIGLPIRNRVDPCYVDSLLLDDVELQNEGIDSISDNECDEDDQPLVSFLAEQEQQEKLVRSGVRKKKRKEAAASRSTPSARTNRTELTWDSSFQQRALPNFKFHEVCGPSRAVSGCKTALDCFMLYFTADIWNVLVEQTNVYYSQSVFTKPSPMPWTDVCVTEFQAFIGIIIAMGIVRLPELDDYWSTDTILHQQWFTSVMSRCRFKQLLRYLHCSDNSIVSGNIDKLGKVRTVLDRLNESFRKLYVPDQCLSVDESMVGTKCKIAFLQYMPKKPKKFGIKLWALCESKTGYCLQFQVYTGKVDSGVEHGLAYRVVFDLMAPYLNKGYKLFMDNFYSSYKLYVDLFSQGTGACGTVRPNRIGFPKELKVKSKMIRGEAKFLHTDTVTAVRWFDKRDVYAMSTFHNDDMVTIAARYNTAEPVSKPKLISDYNENMNGVDRCDQLLVYYALNRKSAKWWKRLFFRLLDMSIINAMILYMSLFPDKKTDRGAHKKFRLELAHQLVQPLLDSYADGTGGRKSGRTPVASDVRLKGKHFAVSKLPRRSCAVCAYEKNSFGKYKKTKTVNFCEKCQKYVCRNCFETFHTRPVDFVDEIERRWAYVACFVILTSDVLKLFVGETFLNILASEWMTKYRWVEVFTKLLDVLSLCLVYFPLLACVDHRRSISANVIGIIYILPWIAIHSLFHHICFQPREQVLELNKFISKVPRLVALLVVGFSYVLDFGINVNRWRKQRAIKRAAEKNSIVVSRYNNRRYKIVHHLQYVETLMRRKDTGDVEEGNRVKVKLQRTASRVKYEKVFGFRYSTRVICCVTICTTLLIWLESSIVVKTEIALKSIEKLCTEFRPTLGNIKIFETVCTNLLAVKIVAHVSSAFSAIVVFIMLIHTLITYKRRWHQLLRGDHTWHRLVGAIKSPHSTLLNGLQYGGYQVAFLIWGWMVLMLCVFALLIFITFAFIIPQRDGGRSWFIDKLEDMWPTLLLGLLIIPLIQSLICRFLFLQEKGTVMALANRRVYNAASYYFLVLNTIVGLFSCLERILIPLVIGIAFLSRLDQPLIMSGYESKDPGYSAFVSMLIVDLYHNHPILKAFVELMDQVRSRKETALEDRNDPDCIALRKQNLRSKRIRNRWWKIVTLANNPSLALKALEQRLISERRQVTEHISHDAETKNDAQNQEKSYL